MDRRCDEAVDKVSEEAVDQASETEFQGICNEEQAKVDVYRVPLFAAAERDVWPNELYWDGL